MLYLWILDRVMLVKITDPNAPHTLNYTAGLLALTAKLRDGLVQLVLQIYMSYVYFCKKLEVFIVVC